MLKDNMQEWLYDIRTSVYGKDMRVSIHDAIKYLYSLHGKDVPESISGTVAGFSSGSVPFVIGKTSADTEDVPPEGSVVTGRISADTDAIPKTSVIIGKTPKISDEDNGYTTPPGPTYEEDQL